MPKNVGPLFLKVRAAMWIWDPGGINFGSGESEYLTDYDTLSSAVADFVAQGAAQQSVAEWLAGVFAQDWSITVPLEEILDFLRGLDV